MSSKTSNNETTKNKNIFIERLLVEANEFTFLGVIDAPIGFMTAERISDIIKVIEDTSGIEEIKCPDRETDSNCHNKNPSYEFTIGHFKPACLSYYKSYRRTWLINAVKATYMDYDPNIPYDYGDISRMVWYRYRQARRYVREEDMRRKREDKQKRKAAYDEIKRIASLKRVEKEERQFMDLAAKYPHTYCYNSVKPFNHRVAITRKNNESDEEWGRRCFNARMKAEQEIKNSKIKDSHNESVLIKFEKWLENNQDYGNYGTDIAEKNNMFSNINSSSFFFPQTKKYKYKIPYDSMYNTLRCLHRQGFGKEFTMFSSLPDVDPLRPGKLIVNVTIEWPKVSKDGFPIHSQIGYSTSTNSWSKLQGNDRTPSPIKMRVCGILPESTLNYPDYIQLTLISNKRKNVSMMFPKQYSEFECMNNSESFTLRECRRFPPEARITNINVHIIGKNMTFDFQGVTKSPAEKAAWLAKVTKNHLTVPRYYYELNDPEKLRHKERQTTIDNKLKKVRADKAAKAAAAREAGLRKRRETTVTKPPATEKIQQLMDLMNLKERGGITTSEYNKLKAELM